MLTIKNLVDEVMLRAQRFDVALELDVQTVQTSVNKARREVQQTTLGLYPERYGRIDVITPDLTPTTGNTTQIANVGARNRRTGLDVKVYKTPLPVDCIDVYDVIFHYKLGTVADPDDRPTFNYEARRLDRRELATIQRHIWNGAVIHAPVYGIDKQISEDRHYLYFAGVDYWDGTTAKNLLVDSENSLFKIEVWYMAALNDLEIVPVDNPLNRPDREIRIPYEFEELIIINSLIDCFQKIDAPQAMESISAEKEQLTSLVSEFYEMSKGRPAGLPSRDALL